MEVCPSCGGAKGGEAVVCGGGRSQVRTVECSFCRGTGRVSADRVALWQGGRRRRDDRVARGVTLREEAKRLGITAAKLSALERGEL
jgi:hypothetical protein